MPVDIKYEKGILDNNEVIITPKAGGNALILSDIPDDIEFKGILVLIGGKECFMDRDEAIELMKCLEGWIQMEDFKARAFNE